MTRWRVRLAALAAALPLSACGYDAIPTKRDRAEAAWAEVQGQYQRRADLIPPLAATVQGAGFQDQAVLAKVLEARARAAAGPTDTLTDEDAFQDHQAAQDELTRALSQLLAAAQDHPQLQTDPNFLILRAQLQGPQTRVAIARRDYDEAARDYNASLRAFPTVIWAGTIQAGSEPMPLFGESPGTPNDGRPAEIGSQ